MKAKEKEMKEEKEEERQVCRIPLRPGKTFSPVIGRMDPEMRYDSVKESAEVVLIEKYTEDQGSKSSKGGERAI